MNLGGPELLIILGLLLLPAVVIWAIVDAALRPEWAWQQAGQSKVLWILLLVGGLVFFFCVGFVLTIVYFTVVRPQVAEAQAAAGYR